MGKELFSSEVQLARLSAEHAVQSTCKAKTRSETVYLSDASMSECIALRDCSPDSCRAPWDVAPSHLAKQYWTSLGFGLAHTRSSTLSHSRFDLPHSRFGPRALKIGLPANKIEPRRKRFDVAGTRMNMKCRQPRHNAMKPRCKPINRFENGAVAPLDLAPIDLSPSPHHAR
jgi:hypothetical protein